MKWPARSPDLNPIENIWGIMARDVYRSGRQFHTVEALVDAIYVSWEKLNRDIAVKLRDTMPKRCISVIERGGAKTDY